jgi:hypothetical protein
MSPTWKRCAAVLAVSLGLFGILGAGVASASPGSCIQSPTKCMTHN